MLAVLIAGVTAGAGAEIRAAGRRTRSLQRSPSRGLEAIASRAFSSANAVNEARSASRERARDAFVASMPG